MLRSYNKEIMVQEVSQPGLSMIGYDPIENVCQYVSTQEINHLALTNRFFCHSTQHSVNLRKLAHYVVLAPNEIMVTAMLNAVPTLVNAVIEQVKDHAGRLHTNKTIFQLAYGAGDDLMCLAMKPYFVKVYGSEAAGIQEMERQRNALSVESAAESLKKEQESKAHLQVLLQPIIAAISAEQFNLGKAADNKWILSSDTLAAIETFRNEFDKSQLNQPKINGMHYRYNTPLETYNTYITAAAQWAYDYQKCALFEDGVPARVLSYVPENDAQKFSQGLYYLGKAEPEPFERKLTLRGTTNNFFSSLSSRSVDFDLPYSSVDCIFGGRGRSFFGIPSHLSPSYIVAFFQNLCRTKTSNLQSLCSRPNHSQNLGV